MALKSVKLDERTVSGILAGKFGGHTKLIHALAAKVNELRRKLEEKDSEKRVLEEQLLGQRKPQVLIVIHADGFIEVSGDSVSVRVENVLRTGPTHERDAIEFIEDSRPWLWKRPLKLLKFASVKDCRDPADELERLQKLELVQILNAMGGK